MHRSMTLHWLALCLALFGILPAFAQSRQIADSRLGVDVLKLTNGRRLYGFVLGENLDRSLRFAVERQWFAATHPDLYQDYLTLESEQTKQSRQLLIERIDQWMAERNSDALLLRFLTSQLATIHNAAQAAEPSPLFMVLRVPRDTVRDVTVQKPQPRKIGGLAYQHRVEKVITTPATLLEKNLQLQGIDVATEQVDLSADVPKAMPESERQWAARKALVEYMYRQPLEYQGSGTTLIRKGETPDAAALMGQMLSGGGLNAIGQLGAELGLPEFKNLPQEPADWWKSATRKAEDEGFCGVLVSRLKQSMLSAEVTVETTFFAKESAGEWFAVTEFRVASNANSQAAANIDRIKKDPQVQSLLDTLGSLGLDAGDRLEQALRHGAATEQALDDACRQFTNFLGVYTQALDGMPVPVQ